MKKILLFAAFLVAFAACEEASLTDEVIMPDSISINPSERALSSDGGKVEVVVTSTGDWTLEGEYGWISVSAVSGVDGDVIVFDAGSNESLEEDKIADYVFRCGEASDEFSLTVRKKTETPVETEPFLSPVSETESSFGYAGQENIEIKVRTSYYYRDLLCNISDKDCSWFRQLTSVEGEDGEVTFVFSMDAFDDMDDRQIGVEISVPDAESAGIEPLSFTLKQEARHRIEINPSSYTVPASGETFTVRITANVKYEVSVPEDATWLGYKGINDDVMTFEVPALTSGQNHAIVTVTQTDAADSETPLTATLDVIQRKVEVIDGEIAEDYELMTSLENAGWVQYNWDEDCYEIIEFEKTEMDLTGFSSESLYGLSIFTQVKSIRISGDIQSIDLTDCTNIEKLEFSGTVEDLREVKLGDNPVKELVYGGDSYWDAVVISGKYLEKIDFNQSSDYTNDFGSIDITGCPALGELHVVRGDFDDRNNPETWYSSVTIYVTGDQKSKIDSGQLTIEKGKGEVVVKG